MSKIRDVYVYAFEQQEKYSTQDYMKKALKEYWSAGSNALLKEKIFQEDLYLLKRTKEGKPYFDGLEEVGISVSHSGKYVICALSDANVGVDIQQKNRYAGESDEAYSQRLCRIAQRFFHNDEAKWIEIEPIKRFYRIFTAKESYVKYTGTGFDETLGENSVLPKDVKTFERKKTDSQGWSTDLAYFWQSEINDEYILCICTDREICPKIVCVDDVK